jgi:PKD repeat protein
VNETWVNSTATTGKISPLLPVFPGCINLPTDLNSDGLYEDINGNGRLDFADVVTYFNNMQWIRDNGLTAYFDYNRNGRIDFSDVVDLFNMKSNT